MLRSFLEKYCPALLSFLRSVRFFLYCRKRYQAFQHAVTAQLYPNGNIRVLTGPFSGLRYYNKIIWGPITPKWLGTYEYQLHGTIHTIIARNYPTIIDVGAAEGYYAVGLAQQCPNTQVISYDIDPIARYRQKQLAQLNHIHNLSIRTLFSPALLQEKFPEGGCIIMDVEGYENTLIDTYTAERFRRFDVLVECHTWKNHSVQKTAHSLQCSLKATHTVTIIRPQTPTKEYLQTLATDHHVPLSLLEKALCEDRTMEQEWLWFQKK